MNVYITLGYTEPDIYGLSCKFQVYFSEAFSRIVKLSESMKKRYGVVRDVRFFVSAKKHTDKIEIRGPGLYKKTMTLEYGLTIPFDNKGGFLEMNARAAGYIVDGVVEALSRWKMDGPKVRALRDKMVQKVMTDPEMTEVDEDMFPLDEDDEGVPQATEQSQDDPSEQEPSEESDSDSKPEIIAIDPDRHHARHVGATSDGRQFILTTPFKPAYGRRKGSEYVALYLFDAAGSLLEAKIDRFGPRAMLDDAKRKACYDKRLSELGEVTHQRIRVKPFAIKRFGTVFGLVIQEPEDEDDSWVVEMQPGNYMAFYEPWDSGDYDT